MTSIRQTFFGDRTFYRTLLTIAVPIMIQNGITNFVSLLDNIMVGQIGTEPMSGVAIVNQLVFVYILCIFGGLSGAGIFTAQYYGKDDQEGIRHTFHYKLLMGMVLTVGATLIFLFGKTALIGSYLTDPSSGSAMHYATSYLKVILLGFPAIMLSQTYASTLRECGETMVPMRAGIIAVFVNLILNYLLIYGKLGFPAMGVVGAAAATTVSRYVEAIIVMSWTHRHPEQNPYVVDLYRNLRVPLSLAKLYFIKGTPLLINETMWSSGMAVLLQCYSLRGLDVVAGVNIANTINNLFNIVFIALGNAVAIVIGQLLGANRFDEARTQATQIITFATLCSVVTAIAMALVSPYFPLLYQTSAESREYAHGLILLMALFTPQNAFMHATFFTLRSGGKTLITFLYDSAFLWVITLPVAYALSRFTTVSVYIILIAVSMTDWIKCILGVIFLRKGDWVQNIAVSAEEA